ncbi:Rv1733c family protein [Streptomyces sp. NPDC002537]
MSAVRVTIFARRWRSNPLRRRTDVLEAWVGAVAVVLMLLTGSAVGWVTGSLAHEALRHTVREQQLHRHLVTATAVRNLPVSVTETDRETAAGREGHHRVIARWAAPDGRAQYSGVVAVRQNTPEGRQFPLWTDDRGRISGRPMDDETAAVHAVLAGAAAAAVVAGLLEGARRLVVWRLMQRRYAQWDRAWEQAGHTWGRADAGS